MTDQRDMFGRPDQRTPKPRRRRTATQPEARDDQQRAVRLPVIVNFHEEPWEWARVEGNERKRDGSKTENWNEARDEIGFTCEVAFAFATGSTLLPHDRSGKGDGGIDAIDCHRRSWQVRGRSARTDPWLMVAKYKCSRDKALSLLRAELYCVARMADKGKQVTLFGGATKRTVAMHMEVADLGRGPGIYLNEIYLQALDTLLAVVFPASARVVPKGWRPDVWAKR